MRDAGGMQDLINRVSPLRNNLQGDDETRLQVSRLVYGSLTAATELVDDFVLIENTLAVRPRGTAA